VVVDALFGAGLSRPLDMNVATIAKALNESGVPVIAVDVPSGLSGDLGRPLDGANGVCVKALATVTFFRKKPGHLLLPGRDHCGETIVADIGIPDQVLDIIRPRNFENGPGLWSFPWPRSEGHKYSRGHAVVVSGPAHATGAARLAARGALRVGAGLVSVASPLAAVGINAAHLTAIMVKPFDGATGLSALLSDRRFNAVALGPGLGTGAETQDLVAAALGSGAGVVLDADALTAFADNPKGLFGQMQAHCVLTPHAGEFERIFPGLLKRTASKLDAAHEAAAAAGCTMLLKGADTIIAAPPHPEQREPFLLRQAQDEDGSRVSKGGRAAINANAPPSLATAGAGDVLTGMIVGLLAQGMNAFDAACAAVWLHGEAANRFGLGLIAEDIPEMLPAVLQALQQRA
jgi:NAD(P)H-hydrate epimerase